MPGPVKSFHTLATLATLAEWEVIGAQGSKCGHVAWLDKRVLLRRMGNQYLLHLRGKLRCTCGNRAGNDVLVGMLDRNV